MGLRWPGFVGLGRVRLPGRLAGAAALALLQLLAAVEIAAMPLEQARFMHLAIRDGLSQNSVTALVQDHHGFLWIGTWDGLNRYDGYEFRVYHPDVGQPGAISDGLITTLALAADGGLWVGTRHGGLNYLDRNTERFTTLKAGPGELPSNYINDVLVTGDGATWVATDRGVTRISGPPEAAQYSLVLDTHAFVLAEGHDGTLWIGSSDGRLHALRNGAIDEVWLGLPAVDGDRAAIRAILADREGEVWIGTHSTELIRVRGDHVVTRYFFGGPDDQDPGRIRSLARDPDGGLWLGGLGTGLVYFDPLTDTRVTFREQPLDPHGLRHDDILALFVDREQALWIGTLSGGLNRVLLGATGFMHHRHQPGVADSLSHDTVTAFALSEDGTLWVGTDGGGINALDPQSGRFASTRVGEGAAEGLARVWALHVDPAGNLWAGTWGAGLSLRRRGETRFAAVDASPGRIITALAEYDGNLWVGSADSGLARLGPDGRLLDHYLPDDALRGVPDDFSVTALSIDDDGAVWIGTWSSGLARLDPDSGGLTVFRHDSQGGTGVPQNRIRALARGRDGTLWLGTGAGLAHYDEAHERIEYLGGRHGLPAGTVYGIVEDLDGRLWLSTNSGLLRHDPERATTRVFTPAEGVQEYEFNGGAFLALPDGKAAFGGINGFNIVDPAAVRLAQAPPKVVITDFLLFGRSMRPGDQEGEAGVPVAASEIESLELAHRYNMLGFRFAAPLPVAPRQLQYAYRLEGFDDDWRLAGGDDRLAVYTNLAPGHYRLRVRAAGADNAWSLEERTVDLRILPPWWRSTPAYVGYLLLALLSIVTLVQWRTYTLRRHAATLQEQVRSRTRRLVEQRQVIEEQASRLSEALETKERLFARVSHEFRTPLTLIVGPIETLLADEPRGRTAQWLRLMRRSARRLMSLVDQLLGLARLSGQEPLVLSPQPVGSVVRAAAAAFDSLAVRKGLTLEVGPVEDAWVNATPELVERIITNLVSNAIRFTPVGGRVRGSVRIEGDAVQISIADNGPGISPEEQETVFEPFHRLPGDALGTGLGLTVVREAAAALGGTVKLDSAPGQGSVFTVVLPTCTPPRAPAGASEDTPPTERMLLEADALAEQPLVEAGSRIGPAAALTGAGDERPHLLLVEDSADLRTLLRAALEPAHRCSEASDGATGISMALDAVPDLVISDVLMPGADGFELTRALKQDPRTSHVPVILLTALGDRSSRLQGLEEHADDYLVKPFDADELRLRVRNLLESRQIMRQRAGIQVYREGAQLPATGAAQPDLHSARERQFLERLRLSVDKRYHEPGTSTAEIARTVAMTERQLQRKLRSLLNLTPGEYLREYRLQKATEQLAMGSPASVVAFDCGFSSQSHFGSCFKARFGVTPGEYRMRKP